MTPGGIASKPTPLEQCADGGGNRPWPLDFGNYRPVSISGRKFEDLDGDGVKDAGEPGLVGWTIELAPAIGPFLQAIVVGVVASLAAAVYPVSRLRRMPVAEAIRGE